MKQDTRIPKFEADGSQRYGEAALQGRGSGIRGFVGQLCEERRNVLEPTRATRVLDVVLSSQKEFVDNVVIQEPLGTSDNNQLHFNINIKSDKTKVIYRLE